ncbi:ABC-type nitrate/sulfonate/bicarbonate transport system, ATPase component [Paracoccus isoporae]|uniref:ABC-type nitrate/sulfonate/bicarbonate transport system, ATPase component n=1 Tax=Paracoccus isoporae TaxID=591205 RepID=A0A1G7CJW6_9RHOB|nr:ABC transporter ATP-binding protein [Paracoccus isoporae]SDE39030.1 ABC-type nitrate/sulfonate/bicarbonate transport system, ATPase component [Paracoccus isoporae]
MTALSIDNLSLKLGGTQVLDDISLHVAEGEFVSILGPSGCGKSSLFRVLTGGVAADRGEVRVDPAARIGAGSAFAFMPQRDALMPWRRIIDNITLGLEVQGISRADARALAEPMLPEFGLAGFDRHYPHELSGGMRQRAALLRTILQGRPIQLLDEPFGALDALTRAGMQRWLERRFHAAGWTTILVTHDVREAVALSDRIYVFSPRPARVVREIRVDAPRPRLGRPMSDASRRIEEQLLDILLEQRTA